jgi:hypothetical protein
MSQKAIAELFDVQVPAIAKHLKNIYEEEELEQVATVSKKEIVQTEGQREVSRQIEFYNLDAIIAVGYRVNSKKATRFRQWATMTLREYIKFKFPTMLQYLPVIASTFSQILDNLTIRTIHD